MIFSIEFGGIPTLDNMAKLCYLASLVGAGRLEPTWQDFYTPIN
jgi:hypothetical protein